MNGGNSTLRLTEAAEAFRVPVTSLRRWLRTGDLHGFRVRGPHGWEWRVVPSTLVAFLEDRGYWRAGSLVAVPSCPTCGGEGTCDLGTCLR